MAWRLSKVPASDLQAGLCAGSGLMAAGMAHQAGWWLTSWVCLAVVLAAMAAHLASRRRWARLSAAQQASERAQMRRGHWRGRQD